MLSAVSRPFSKFLSLIGRLKQLSCALSSILSECVLLVGHASLLVRLAAPRESRFTLLHLDLSV